MKNIFITLLFIPLLIINSITAQNSSNPNMWLNVGVVVPDSIEGFTTSHIRKIERKILSIINKHGAITKVSGSLVEKGGVIDFTVLANGIICYPMIEIYDSEVIDAGLRKLTVTEIEFSLFIQDVKQGSIFSEVTKVITASGKTEKQALNDFIRQIKVNDSAWKPFLDKAKKEVLAYYTQNCEFIIEQAIQLQEIGLPEQALTLLLPVPTEAPCYTLARQRTVSIYQEYIEKRCENEVLKAEARIAEHDYSTALDILSEIAEPTASCAQNILSKIEKIKLEVDEDEQQEIEKFWKMWNDEVELEKHRLQSAGRIAGIEMQGELSRFRKNSRVIVID